MRQWPASSNPVTAHALTERHRNYAIIIMYRPSGCLTNEDIHDLDADASHMTTAACGNTRAGKCLVNDRMRTSTHSRTSDEQRPTGGERIRSPARRQPIGSYPCCDACGVQR